MDVLIILLALYIFVKPPQWLNNISRGIEKAIEDIDKDENVSEDMNE